MPPPPQGPSTNGCKRQQLHSTLGLCKLQRSGTRQSLQPELNATGGCYFNPQTGHLSLDFLRPTRLFRLRHLWWKPRWEQNFSTLSFLTRSLLWPCKKGLCLFWTFCSLLFRPFCRQIQVPESSVSTQWRNRWGPAKNFNEALTTLRTWRQQILTVVTDLQGNPEPLKLFRRTPEAPATEPAAHCCWESWGGCCDPAEATLTPALIGIVLTSTPVMGALTPL